MPRRPDHSGTIVRRTDGRYQGSIQVNGTRKTVYGKSEREVLRKLDALKVQATTLGGLPNPGRRTVADLLDAWLEAVTPTLKPATAWDYRFHCAHSIVPVIGRISLARLEPLHLQHLCTSLQASGNRRTPAKVHTILRRALSLAVRWGWLAANPAERVLPPSYRAPRRELWDESEIHTFLSGTQNHWLFPLWLFLLGTGCRIGEALGLAWQSVDLARGQVRIERNGQWLQGEWIVGEPKTKAGRRVLSLPPLAVAALRKQRAQQAAWRLQAGQDWQASDLVFTGELGKPLHRSVPVHALQRACNRLGLPIITTHDLRHIHASVLLKPGLSLPAVAQRLGHSNPTITLGVYAHVLGGEDKRAAEAIGKALGA